MEYFRLSPLLVGETVFVLGGGPSLSLCEIERLKGKRVITINNAVYVAPWADVLLFRDLKWYVFNRDAVYDFKGLVITPCVSANYGHNVNVVRMFHSDNFMGIGDRGIRYGRSAGHIALSLVASLGAKRAVLLGFDCRIVDGRSHFHDKIDTGQTAQTRFLYENDFLPAWIGWNNYCKQTGTEVVNATKGSAIQEFPFKSLDEILAE